jgi:hypothetical protein
MALTKLEIQKRLPFAGGRDFGEIGAYEQIIGKLSYSIDPARALPNIGCRKLRRRKYVSRVCYLEHETRFELATLTLASRTQNFASSCFEREFGFLG